MCRVRRFPRLRLQSRTIRPAFGSNSVRPAIARSISRYCRSVNTTWLPGRQGFAPFQASAIRINIGRTVRIAVKLEVAAGHTEVTVSATGATVDLGSTLGNVISSREATDLPLNGRNFTQLGLLQPGVAPLTGGLARPGVCCAPTRLMP